MAEESNVVAIPAAALVQDVELNGYEAFLLVQVLAGDRHDPSRDRAKRRRSVVRALVDATEGAEILEDLYSDGAFKVRDKLREKVMARMTREVMDAVADFAKEAAERKDEKGKAFYSGADQDHFWELAEKMAALRGKS